MNPGHLRVGALPERSPHERVKPTRMNTPPDTIRLALPSKGHLYDGVVEILKTAGYKVKRASDRQYEATIAS